MHHLILDTCVWIDLAVSQFSLVSKLKKLIDQGEVAIVIPSIVKAEWERNRQAKVVDPIVKNIVAARREVNSLVEYIEDNELASACRPIRDLDPQLTGIEIATKRIKYIEDIFGVAIVITEDATAEDQAIATKLALESKAPFRSKNSMADALLFLATVTWVRANSPPTSTFVTHNTSDFSDKKADADDYAHKTRLAPELEPYAASCGLSYRTVAAELLNEISDKLITSEEVERGKAASQLNQLIGEIPCLSALEALARGLQAPIEEIREAIARSYSPSREQRDAILKGLGVSQAEAMKSIATALRPQAEAIEAMEAAARRHNDAIEAVTKKLPSFSADNTNANDDDTQSSENSP